MFRLRAFTWHLSGSIVWGFLALWLVFRLWYPAPLHLAVGVTHIFFVILVVDVVLGPFLTFLVFTEHKKRHLLMLDLTVILMLQIGALLYGVWTVAEGRPVWLVFSGDRFDLVRAYEVDRRYSDQVAPEYKRLSLIGPRWVAARIPEDILDRNTLTFESVLAGVDIPQRPDLYVAYVDEAVKVRDVSFPLDDLYKFNMHQDVERVLAEWPEADAYLPLMAPVESLTVLLKRQTAEVISVVQLKPWE